MTGPLFGFVAVTSASASLILVLLIVTSSLAQNPTDYAESTQYTQNHTDSYQNEFGHNEKDSSTLLLVQVIFRHGDRSPLYSFPTDSHRDDWPQGYGQLTELGMTQGYELGQFLNRRYSNFLGQGYKPEEVKIQSTDKDRTLMTAQCVAAGLFPNRLGTGKTSQFIMWQPIPVHTMPRKQDRMLSPDKVCSYVKDLKYGLKAYFYSQQDIMKDKRMMFAFSRFSGLVMNFTTLHYLADTLYCQKVHNMSLPSWLTDSMESNLFSFYHQLPVLMPEEAKYLAGTLLETLIDNMVHKAENPLDKRKLNLYSAHEGNLHSLMSLLGVFHKDTIIPYASAIIVELHRIHDKLFVRLLYRTSDASDPEILTIEGCKSGLCHMSAFTDLLEEPIQKAWEDVCGPASHENVIDFGENTIPILVAVLVVFICLDFFLLYKTFKYRQRLHCKNDKESYALVRTNVGSSSSSDSDADEYNDLEMDSGTKVLLSKERHNRKHQQHTRNFLNGGNRVNGMKDKGRISDDEDSFEETALFVSPAKPTK